MGDDETHIVSAAGTIEVSIDANNGKALIEALAREIESHIGANARRSPGELVIGLPLNMDGTEGPRAKHVRAFARMLAERTHRDIRFQDERLTTVEADWQMSQTGMTRQQKKSRRDALSAANILRDFLSGTAQPDDDQTESDAEI